MSFDLIHSTLIWCQKKQITYSYKDTLNSTQILAKNEIESNHSVFFTTVQTAGRGRGQNQWLNTAKPNQLFLSTWKLHTPKNILPVFSCKMGLAIYNSLKKAWPSGAFSIKAPNDIYLDDKKVVGLLIESTSFNKQNVLFIGIGLNVLAAPDLLTATSLYEADLKIDDFAWWNYLESLFKNLKNEIERIDQKLDDQSKLELVAAMNLFPDKKAEIKSIDCEGNIFTSHEKISWSEL